MSPRGVRLTWALLLGFFSLTIGCGRGGFFGGGYVCPEPGACEVWVGASSSAPMVRVGGPTPGNPIEGPYACPPGTLLTGLYTEYESNDRLIGFRMHCHELSLNEATGTLATVNPVDGGENFGSQAMEYTQDLDCGANLVVSSLRAYTGAWQAGTADTQVMDRIEVGCSSISVDIDGTSVTGPPQYIAQTLLGTSGILPNSQVQETGSCPEGEIIAALATSGGGHADHFDIYCAGAVVFSP